MFDRAISGAEIRAAGQYGETEGFWSEGRIFPNAMLDADSLKGELLYQDDFLQPWTQRWTLEGPGKLALEPEGGLRMDASEGHVVLWNHRDFPSDFIADE